MGVTLYEGQRWEHYTTLDDPPRLIGQYELEKIYSSKLSAETVELRNLETGGSP